MDLTDTSVRQLYLIAAYFDQLFEPSLGADSSRPPSAYELSGSEIAAGQQLAPPAVFNPSSLRGQSGGGISSFPIARVPPKEIVASKPETFEEEEVVGSDEEEGDDEDGAGMKRPRLGDASQRVVLR